MKKIAFDKIFKSLGFKKNDKVLISSNLLKLIILKKRKKIRFDLKDIINNLIKIIGREGTIIVPIFNWNFCKGLGFHYKKTLSNSGALGNYVLTRKDFRRTKNPIYSFSVFGKDKDYLANMEHKSCFEFNSPFGYMIKNNCKNLYIDIENIYRNSFTICHVAEQEVGVKYRYLKKFSGKYIHLNYKSKKSTFTMYVRKLSLKIRTGVNPKIKQKLVQQNSYFEKNINNINFKIIKMKNAYKIMKNSLKNNGKIIFAEKL